VDIQKGDGVILFTGGKGIVTSGIFEMNSHHTDNARVRVRFDDWEGPIQLEAIEQVWREGQRIDNIQQMSLWGDV
jgi:hypothetical protein